MVRNRETIDELKKDLADLGADEVYTEEEVGCVFRNFSLCKQALPNSIGTAGITLGKEKNFNV